MNLQRFFSVGAPTRSIRVAMAACSIIALNSMAHAESVSANGDVHLTAATYTVAESAGSVIVTATRSGGTSGTVSVTYTTENDTAVAGVAFAAKSGTLTWANGDGSNKTISIPIMNTKTTGTKAFFVRLKAVGSTILGTHTGATVDIVSSSAATAPSTTKSIKEWGVSCSDTIDDTAQLKAAMAAAANNAFTLVIDCPVRFHTGSAGGSPVAVPDGVTMSFLGSGEFLTTGVGLTVANLSAVTFIDFNMDVL